ncbi:hypothetical protein QOZ80_1BG0097010 [Eleusine coracana subsp. coracana]|nr:hypothetical protein QOZ80_1BG0097010 [Eleusine coracana subsp. coracana]
MGLTDHHFVPTKWVLLNICKDDPAPITENDIFMFLKVDSTGRFLVRSMPWFGNRDYFLPGTTNDGLLLLGKTTYPYQARLVNPFTGSVAHFKASIPRRGVWGVAVTTSPIFRVFISGKERENGIMWADPDSECFHEILAVNLDGPLCMAPLAGNVYLANTYGSILSPSPDVADGSLFPTLNTIIPNPENLQPESLENGRYYLVESGGDLFLVTRPCRDLPKELVVRRVDITKRVLEPVRDIGDCALFVIHIRCLAVNASKFPTVEGGCVYFVDPVIRFGRCSYKSSFMTMFRVADGVQHRMFYDLTTIGGYSAPSTLTLQFAEYCNYIPYLELHQCTFEEEEFWDDFEGDQASSLMMNLLD